MRLLRDAVRNTRLLRDAEKNLQHMNFRALGERFQFFLVCRYILTRIVGLP